MHVSRGSHIWACNDACEQHKCVIYGLSYLEENSLKQNFASVQLDALVWVLGLNVLSVTISLPLVHQALHAHTPGDNILFEITSLQVVRELTPLLHVLGCELDALQVRWDGHLNLFEDPRILFRFL